ncbi:MAG: 30S ribosome-binding factor RbfA [Candidatus Omnitrophica bacterium]|nr:30S ribosome-binding factor RbfA [Candidatus Omnitrophota bacterium]
MAGRIKREVALIILEEINDPRIKRITIMRVEVTKDLGYAKIYFTSDLDEKGKEAISIALRRAGSFIRKSLAERISLRFMPHVSFVEDVKEEKVTVVEEILEKLAKEKQKDIGANGKDQ